MVNPYSDSKLSDTHFIRNFDIDVEDEELIWHRDRKDREILVIKGEGWKLQFDNELPKALQEGERYFIKAETYHRILKGSTSLTLEIKEKE